MSTTTTTLANANEDLNSSGLLSQSVSSAGSPRRHSKFSKPFKQASHFFLTRRFSDALTAINPLITGQPSKTEYAAEKTGEHIAPVAGADRKWRIKIWSFYITLQNAILELGADDGKKSIGLQEWNAALDRVKDGSIWDQIVNTGYEGDETLVDAEVVLNLANLLLAQSPNQKRNQDYIETFLSVAPEASNDVKHSGSAGYNETKAKETGNQGHKQPQTLRNLEVQLEIIELFALHVLPQNEEWQYARDFLQMNEILDEERRESLLQALDDLENGGYGDSDNETQDAAFRHLDHLSANPSAIAKLGRTDSSVTVIPAPTTKPSIPPDGTGETEKYHTLPENHALRPISPRPDEASLQPPPRPREVIRTPGQAPKPTKNTGQASILRRAFALYDLVSQILLNTTAQLTRNPAPLLRFILFIIVLVGTLGRTDLRERLKRVMHRSLGSIRHTLGMGFKASSI